MFWSEGKCGNELLAGFCTVMLRRKQRYKSSTPSELLDHPQRSWASDGCPGGVLAEVTWAVVKRCYFNHPFLMWDFVGAVVTSGQLSASSEKPWLTPNCVISRCPLPCQRRIALRAVGPDCAEHDQQSCLRHFWCLCFYSRPTSAVEALALHTDY